MDAWMPGIPREPNFPITNPANLLVARGCVTHRTIGNWAGDLAVLKRGRVPSCHYLVGQKEGQWCQMVSNNVVANHAAGANSWAVGIEVSGQNGEPFTPWQITACSRIVNFLVTSGIQKNRYRGKERVNSFHGFIDHAFIATEPKFMHYDYWNPRDWDAVAGAPTPPPEPPPEPDPPRSDMFLVIDTNKKAVVFTGGRCYSVTPETAYALIVGKVSHVDGQKPLSVLGYMRDLAPEDFARLVGQK